MSVSDARGRAPFGVVYRDDLSHPVIRALSARAFRLYVALTTYARSGRGRVHPSRATLADLLGVSMRTVQRAMAELVSAGVVERLLETDERGVPLSAVVLTSRECWGGGDNSCQGGGDNSCQGDPDTRCQGDPDTYRTEHAESGASSVDLDAQQTTRTDQREQIPPNPPQTGGARQTLASELEVTRQAVEHVEGVLVDLLQDRRDHGWSADEVDLDDPGRGLIEVLVDQVRFSPFIPNSVACMHRRKLRRLITGLLSAAYAKTNESDAEDAREAAEQQATTRYLVDATDAPPNVLERWHELIERALRVDLVAGNVCRLATPDLVDGVLGLNLASGLADLARQARLGDVLDLVFAEMRTTTAP